MNACFEHLGSNLLWASCLILGFALALCYAALGVPAKRRMAQQARTSSTN